MEYDVPQFVEEEAKIFGPLTLRDFFIFFGVFLLSAAFFFMFQLWLAIILAAIVIGCSAALLLIRVNGRPLYAIVFAAIRFFWAPRLYLWEKEAIKKEEVLRERLIKKQEPQTKTFGKDQAPHTLTRETIVELASQLDAKAQPAGKQLQTPKRKPQNPQELTPEKIKEMAKQ